MKDKTRAIILDLLKDKAHEIKHQEFNGRSESQYKSFIELKEDRISDINDCIQDLGLSNEWVSVEKDYPEDGRPVWVRTDNGDVFIGGRELCGDEGYLWGRCYDSQFIRGGEWVADIEVDDDYKVVAWYPLPPSEAKS